MFAGIFFYYKLCYLKLLEIRNDIKGAYRLMLDSLQAYNRWSKIKLDIKKDLGRGEKAALKDRLEEICKYLKEVHITSRMIWNKAKDDLNNNKEF